uniref:SAM domain-containing protein n=1 Tax=Dunaliella tertiolecta TaxID=3047 RepID=A0A7S3R4X4_DUNTE
MNDYAAGLDWLPSPVSVFDIHGNVLFSNWASTKFAPVSLPQGITAGKLGLVSELDSQLLPVCTWTEKELTPAKGCSDGSEVRVLSCNAFVNEGSRESGPVFIVTRHDITSLCKQHQFAEVEAALLRTSLSEAQEHSKRLHGSAKEMADSMAELRNLLDSSSKQQQQQQQQQGGGTTPQWSPATASHISAMMASFDACLRRFRSISAPEKHATPFNLRGKGAPHCNSHVLPSTGSPPGSRSAPQVPAYVSAAAVGSGGGANSRQHSSGNQRRPKQQQQQQVSSQSNALEAGAKGAMANGVGIDAGSTAALQPPASPNVLSNGDKAPPEVNGVVTTTPRVTKPMTTLTKPWEKEDMEDDINLQPADTSGLFGDAAVNPLAQSHNSFLLQHDEDGPEDVKPVGPPQKGTRRIQKSGPPTRMSTRGSLREGALVSHGATHFGIHNINGSNSSPIPVTPNAAEGAANLELRDALQSQLDALQDRLLQAGREAASARDDASTQRKQARQLMEQLQLLEQRGGSFSTPNRSPSVSRSQIAQLRFGETTRHPSLDHGRPPPWVTDARSHWPAQDPSSSRAQVALAQSQSPAAYNPPTKNPPPMRINTAPPELEKPLTWVVSTSNSPSPNRAPGAAGAHTHSLGLGLGGGAALLAQASSGSNLLLPPLSLAHLFADLGLDGYLGRFEEEAVHLDMLLTMDFKQLDALGLRPLGHCIRVRESVLELAKGLLRMCEGRAAASSAGSKMRVVIPQDLET